MTNLKSRIFYLFLFIFLIVGSITSLNVGISHDEWHEEENWKYNVALSKNIKNHIISEKFNMTIKKNLVPILCIGETLDQKEKSLTEEIINSQITDRKSVV